MLSVDRDVMIRVNSSLVRLRLLYQISFQLITRNQLGWHFTYLFENSII